MQTVKKQKVSSSVSFSPTLELTPSQEDGIARPSFLLSHLDAMEGGEAVTDEDMEILKGAATSMFAAGEDTVNFLS